ncbi:MAG: sugar transferase [Bacteroidales bacterium]
MMRLCIRIIDLIFSLIGLILLSPFFIIIIVYIKIDSRGPIFYQQIRVGKDGIQFRLWKFRTMLLDSDKKGLLTVGKHDPRITHAGLWLRKNKLDELPQLFNVLKNDMSIVGPRPEVQKYVDLYSDEQKKVLSIKPGITDYASIKYAYENELLKNSNDPEKKYIEEILPLKIELNMKYIKNPNISQYLYIIFLTFKRIL